MKNETRWEQARELFLDLADLAEERREDELERLVARDPELARQVRDLLRHDREPPGGPRAATDRSFGPYEVVRPIGRGGMGEVFVARRADGEYEREVAVKLLREGTANRELVQRFLRERQTLARLNHEYIARLLDGGTTLSGEPYLVMEYVEGEPADVFAARLELPERLRLFVRIGQAVAHAHELGVVHRDLKPSNILVRSDGTPRLLDFGIARPDATTQAEAEGEEPLTRTGHRLFTPEFASPEQVRGEVATAQSDVFALGVILYEFLCGRRPWATSANLHELERNICESDPTPPSRLATGTTRSRLAGDLDAVVLQCLAKRPERRYGSVAELCDDLERHLAGLPIRARRTGAVGRALRFARRKPAYPVVGALSLVALFAFGFAWETERRGLRRREELVAAVTDRIAAAQMRHGDGEIDVAEAELDAALVALRELPDEPRLEAEVLTHKAVYANLLDQWDRGLELATQAQAVLDRVEAPDPRLVARLLNARTYALQGGNSGEDSRPAAQAALDYARANLEPGDVLRVDALTGWAHELHRTNQVEDALDVLGEAASEARRNDPNGQPLGRILNERALALARQGRFEESVEHYRESIEILGWHHGERHPSFAAVRINLGTTLFRLGRFEEARREHEQSLTTSRHLDLALLVAANQHFLGRIHCALGDLAAAEACAHEAIAIRASHGLDLHTGRSRCLLGIVYAREGRAEEARATLQPLLDAAGPDAFLPDMEAEARHLLGALLDDRGDSEAARPHLQRALELKRELLGASHGDCAELSRRLGEGG